METARTQSLREDGQNIMNSWSRAAEEMCPSVGSGDTAAPLIAAHTPEDTSQSTLRNVSVERAASSSALCLSPPMTMEKTLCKENNKMNSEDQEKHLRSPARAP